MKPGAPSTLAAIITAGGASRRFGRDKALARLDGQTLLERVAGSLDACSPKLIVAPPGKYALTGWTLTPDARPGEGPLAGLETGLGALPPHTWAAFAAVDLPHLTPAFWSVLSTFTARGRRPSSVTAPTNAPSRWRRSTMSRRWARSRRCWTQASGA